MKLNGIRLLVKDFERCFRFYNEQLGLKVTWGKPDGEYASFDIGMKEGEGLSLFKSDYMAQAIGNSDLPFPGDSREKMMIVIEVEDVDTTYQELSGKGIKFINQPTTMGGWGMRTVHLRDTEGNLIEFFTAIPLDQWDKDLLEENKEYAG